MGKTHEALERAGEEFQQSIPRAPQKTRRKDAARTPRRATKASAVEWYDDLRANLFTRYPKRDIRSILFNATCHGGGSSTTALNFAIALAKDSNLKVLLVEVNFRTPSLRKTFDCDERPLVLDFGFNNNMMDSQIRKVGPGELYLLAWDGTALTPLKVFESNQFDEFLAAMRLRFDYIILDAPPVPRFSECRILCSKVDGVVLVIEAGKTRRQIALRAKKELEETGANLLGVVLNKRKHYIPEWVYRRF